MSTESDPTNQAKGAELGKMPQTGGPPKKHFMDFVKGRYHGETGPDEQSKPVDMSQKVANIQKDAAMPKEEPKKNFMDFVKGRYHGEVGPEQAKAEASSREQTPRASVESRAKDADVPMEYKPKKSSFRAFMKGELQE
jgi:hypothetical protein